MKKLRKSFDAFQVDYGLLGAARLTTFCRLILAVLVVCLKAKGDTAINQKISCFY